LEKSNRLPFFKICNTNIMESKTHWKKFFKYDYLGSADLVGGDLVLTIQKLKKEKVKGPGGREDECLVCYWQEKDFKPMVMNRTNCKTIHKMHQTAFIEEWPGKQVQLFVDHNVKYKGEITDGIRIRPLVPAKTDPLQAEILALEAKVRSALKSYKGDDISEIRTMLTEKKKAKELSVELLSNTLKDLTNGAVLS